MELGATPPFEAVFNFRDLGGLPTTDGRTTRAGVLFRSASWNDATPKDMAVLAATMGVKTLIDLRQHDEIAQFPMKSAWPGKATNVPLFGPDEQSALFATLGAAYVAFLKRPQVARRLVEVVQVLGALGTAPAVYYCAAGKDRTGLVTAAVLGSLGVPDDMIVADYTDTNEHLDAMYRFWAKNALSSIDEHRKLRPELVSAPAEAMRAVLASVRADFGSMRGYLSEHGTSQTVFEGLERTLLG